MGGKTEKKTSAVKKSSAKNSKASKPEPKQKISKTAAKTAKKTTAVKKSAAKEKVPVKKIPALKKSEIKKESNVVSKTPDVSVVKASAKPVALKSKDYGDDKIIHLDALEHIRLRSGMYIGRLGDGSNQNDGIYILLKEVVDNAVDEFIMGFGKKIEIEVKDSRVKVRDYGRGIPLGKVVECVSEINTGAKYNDDVFQFSVGMNGGGTKAVNALSSYFRVVSVREGQ